MSGWRDIPSVVTARQLRASDPKKSVWVSANAGSGKTHVLVQRVLRHLLAGVPPAKILCLTFTKAAAANMADKVFATLAQWTEIDDAALADAINSIGAGPTDAAKLLFARRLFARTVETPGGLKIHTIHAFCERLLHLFPFEANVPGRFEVLDDLGQADLLILAKQEALKAAQNDHGPLGLALKKIVAETSQDGFDELIAEAMAHRALFRNFTPEDVAARLRRLLNLGASDTLDAIERDMIEGGIAPDRWKDIANFLEQGLKTDKASAQFLRAAFTVKDDRDACLSEYLKMFFIKEGEGKARESLVTQTLAKTNPRLVADLEAEQTRLEALRARRTSAACFERSTASMTLINAVLARYKAAKAVRGKLDFDDLISRTVTLLQRSDARWVMFKLDSGIDHILVDEAQDTSEAQWTILEELSSEFAAGLGSRPYPRTFFAVGDEKQSIFSFQGAAPHMFHEMRSRFAQLFGADQSFEHVELKESFRSVPAVLTMIDEVFASADHQRGLVSDDIWMGHAALKRDLPGLVEIWPPTIPEAQEEPRDWRLPLDFLDESDPASRLAGCVAQKIADLVAPSSNEHVFDSDLGRFRPVAAGDILILVRSRGPFFDAVIRALKQKNIPVAGADRLKLTDHIAVMDLIAAGRAALLPLDDLTLAAVLKSPLIGLDDDDLLAIAPKREKSLIEALAASSLPRHQAAYATLLKWRTRAALTPFDFYARLLSEDGGRRAIEGRLGAEACDVIDEFLRQTLHAEQDGIFSLAHFLDDVEAADLEIKRDMETSGASVRVMTVHAAKGLEAKIVFLPDTCSVPSPRHDPKIFCLEETSGAKIPVWSPRKDSDPTCVAQAREKARAEAEDEHRRLLYVALTRAEERLYIAGFYRAREPGAIAWNTMIQASLGEGFEEVPAFWDRTETILRRQTEGHAKIIERESAAAAASSTALPDFLLRPAPIEENPAPPLTPANALAAADAFRDNVSSSLNRAALERGRLMHTLLQYLPQVSPKRRRKAAQIFLDARADHLKILHPHLIDEAISVLTHAGLDDLFGPQARAEVSIVGHITLPNGATRAVSGQVDRLVETESEVIVADFKTGTLPTDGAVPTQYLTQMALYRAALAPIWPGKRLRMVLIFTAGPRVVTLSESALAEALTLIPAKPA